MSLRIKIRHSKSVKDRSKKGDLQCNENMEQNVSSGENKVRARELSKFDMQLR